jgi:hypothetical protein
MADAVKPVGHGVLEEAANELVSRQGHRLGLAILAGRKIVPRISRDQITDAYTAAADSNRPNRFSPIRFIT